MPNLLIIKHAEIEGPGSIESFFNNAAWDIDIADLSKGGALPINFKTVDAVVSLGGPMNVYEEAAHPFLKDEDIFLKKTMREEIPILGICLGAQLLAKAAGAKVRKAPAREIGWYKIRLSDSGKDDPLFAGLPSELCVFQWHEDTFDIPKGGILTASGNICKNQALRIGKNGWGLQFHVEMTLEMIEDWALNFPIDKDDLMKGYKKASDTYNRYADLIYSNFCAAARRRS